MAVVLSGLATADPAAASRKPLRAESHALKRLYAREHHHSPLGEIRVSLVDNRWSLLLSRPSHQGHGAQASNLRPPTIREYAHRTSGKEDWEKSKKPPATKVKKDLAKKPVATVSYNVWFDGSADYRSKWDFAIEGSSAGCENVVDTTQEADHLQWHTLYSTLDITRKGRGSYGDFVGGTTFRQEAAHWKQTVTLDRPACFGGNRTCEASLLPELPHGSSSARGGPPRLGAVPLDSVEHMGLQPVPSWTISNSVSGNQSGCQLYRGDEAFQPWSIGNQDPRAIRDVMEGYVNPLLKKLREGKKFSLPVIHNDTLPGDCHPGTGTCTQTLTNWVGTVEFVPVG
jgi:hypothetical protein